MRKLLVLLIPFLCTFCKPAPLASPKKFRIEIHQTSMSMDATLIFSSDSLFGKGYYLGGRRDSIFMNRKPTAAETEKILNTLATLEIDSLHPELPQKTMDDGIEFTFIISYGTISKTTDIYMQKEENLLKLTDVLNTLLPAGNKINYNEHYIENGY